MTRGLTLALLITAGCGVKLEQGLDGGTTDARITDATADAAPVPDAPPDARPCTGGDAHMADSTGACFVFFLTPRLYADAQTACAAIAAHLATVPDAATNTLITGLAANTASVYIGATDAVTEGTFLWQDGSAVTYTNWRTGEPSNGQGQYQEDCVVIQPMLAGVWDDRPCAPPPANAGSYAYVCQY